MDLSGMTEALPANDQFTPIYYRIQESMRRRIVEGEFQPGARLPSESELARDFGTTRVTVRHALMRLVYDGLIERHSGRGTFVRESSSIVSRIDTLMGHSFAQEVSLRGKVVTYATTDYKLAPAPQEAAAHLSVGEGRKVHQVESQRRNEKKDKG